MKAAKAIATYRRLREQPLWRLLAAHNAPATLSLLQAHLYEGQTSLPASILHERLARDLETLRAGGEDLPQTAQAYLADWLRDGYLERRFPAGAAEEEYELSSAAASAIRVIGGLMERRSAATESRLAVVIQQLMELSEVTDPNPESRLRRLLAEREKIDREIERVRSGAVETLSEAQASERIREIITLAEGLAADFRRVRDEFEGLNRELRERLLDETGSRGEVLENLFAGVDVIAESDAGRTFSAFWRLLTDPEQSAALDESLDQVMGREFARRLEPKDRRFLLSLTRTLLAQGGTVHEALQRFAAGLKNYVQSREYLEQRLMNKLLREAQRAAVAVKDQVRGVGAIEYSLRLTSARLGSVSQWSRSLYDPSLEAPPAAMTDAEAPAIDLEAVRDLVAQSEIDFRGLHANIRAALEDRAQVTIGEVMDAFPAEQGLGTVVGYLAIGSRHGVAAGRREIVQWRGLDAAARRARIPVIYFLKERVYEIV